MESKIEATKRLQREGRWNEASCRREQIREELRAKGMCRREAVAEAWRVMTEEFPPLPPAPVDVPADDAGSDEDANAVDGVRDAILLTAEAEVRRWCGQHGVKIGGEAFGDICGTLGAFWALGTLGELPTPG